MPPGDRRLTKKLRTAKGRSISSTLWLERQINDPFVADARRMGFRSRAAFKLIAIDDKLHLLKQGRRVLDLGAAPGGWTQIAVDRVKSQSTDGPRGKVVALDISEMAALPGATVLQADFLDDATPARVREAIGGTVDVVLCDMAPAATGHRDVDHLRIVGLVEAALHLACEVLTTGGAFVAKLTQGGQEDAIIATARKSFAVVRRVKPPASRAESAEFYVVATGFGRK